MIRMMMKVIMMVEQKRKFAGKRHGFTEMIKMFYSSLEGSIYTGVCNFKTHEIENFISCMLFHVYYVSIGSFRRNIYNLPCLY